MSLPALVEGILQRENRLMRAAEIAEILKEEGLWDFSGVTSPRAAVAKALQRRANSRGKVRAFCDGLWQAEKEGPAK